MFKANQPDLGRGEPWFDDGNFVLLSDDNVRFRIHRGVLARQSEVFQSMLDFPQPSGSVMDTDIETDDGYPVVRMYDQAVELSILLKAIYDGVSFPNCDIDDFFFLASVLRLATKYLIAHLRRQAIEALARTWSHTLEGHDAMVDRALQAPLGTSPTDLTYPYVHPLHVLNLARDTHVRIVVPAALYFLSVYPCSDLVRGEHPKLAAPSRAGLPRPSGLLSAEDMTSYTLMYQHRIELILDFVRRFCGERRSSTCCERRPDAGAEAPPESASTSSSAGAQARLEETDPCSHALARLASKASRSWYPRTGPLRWMMQTVELFERDPAPCGECKGAFRSDVEVHRHNVWRALPGVVGLPGWSILAGSDLPRLTQK